MQIKKIIDFGTLFVTSIFWVTISLYSLKFAIPNSAIKLPGDSRTISSFFKMVLPEGFGFFTRNPRETRFLLYKSTDKGVDLVTEPNAGFEYSGNHLTHLGTEFRKLSDPGIPGTV